jgi:hypothetical protein
MGPNPTAKPSGQVLSFLIAFSVLQKIKENGKKFKK